MIPKDFDWKFYLSYYKDLTDSGLKTKCDAESHFLKYGLLENRKINEFQLSKIEKNDFFKKKYLKQAFTQFENINNCDFDIIRNHQLKNCRLSVIISLYNYEKFINKAIDSVINNDFDSCEIVVVNDSSTDDSLNRVKDYLNKNCNLTIINKGINTGLSHTRNLGIQNCIGDYVFILDADNQIYSNCLESLYNFMLRNDLDAAYSSIECFNENNDFIKFISNEDYDYEKLKAGPYIDAMAMFKKDRLIESGMYDLDMLKIGIGWEDYDLWLKIGKLKYKISHLDEIHSKYIVKEDSMLSLTDLFIQDFIEYLKKKYNF